MSSLPFLTSELQALSKEAGRRHPDVKDAADKALGALKASSETALSDLKNASDEDLASARYPSLLAPVVLGCATKNAKVISIAVGALQRLVGIRDAVTAVTVPIILTTLRSVLSQGVEIQLKTLQTLSSLLTNCKEIHGDLLAETLLISFKLQESKIGVVSSTAAATLRQLVMFVFDAVDDEDKAVSAARDDPSMPGPIPTDFSVDLPSSDASDPTGNSSTRSEYLLPSAKDAYMLFDDICLLINGEPAKFLQLQNLPRTFGLELIESVLADFSLVFRRHPELLHLLRTALSPLLIRSLAEKPTFSTTLRLMRVMYLLLKKFNDDLIMESEIFLSIFVRVVGPGEGEGAGGHPLGSTSLPSSLKDGTRSHPTSSSAGAGGSPPWMRVLALEILRGLCSDFELLSKVWARYDAVQEQNVTLPSPTPEKPSGAPLSRRTSTHQGNYGNAVFRKMITALNRLATEKPSLLGTGTAVVSGVSADLSLADYSVGGVVDGLVGMAAQAASTVGVSGVLSQGGLAVSTASVKLQCIDQLDKADAPAIPETYVYLLSLQCLNAIADGFAGNTLQTYQHLMSLRPKEGEGPLTAPPALTLDDKPEEPTYTRLRLTKAMANAGWPALLASLSFFLTTNLDDDLFTHTLTSYQNFTTTCGVLGLNTPRDAFLTNLCRFAVPPSIVSQLSSIDPPPLNKHHSASIISASTEAFGITSPSAPATMSLSTRNLLCLRSLVGVSQALAGSLDQTWFYVFEALQNADCVLKADIQRRQKKRSHPPAASSSSGGAVRVSSSSVSNAGSSASNSAAANAGASGSANNRYVPTDSEEQTAQQRNARLYEVSKALDDQAFKWFVGCLCRLNGEMIGLPTTDQGEVDTESLALTSPIDESPSAKPAKRSGVNVIRTLRPGESSYAVARLGDVSLMNMQRLISRSPEIGWDVVVGHLLLVQQWQTAPAEVRTQAAEVFDKIVTEAPRAFPSNASEEVQSAMQEQILKALAEQSEPQSRTPSSTDVDIRKAALDTLLRLLESHGHSLLCGWTPIFDILSLACPPIQVAAGSGQQGSTGNVPTVTSVQTSSKSAATLLRVAFPSLQLICSDFLAALSTEELQMCINTLAGFGKQTEDVNVALTAGGLLWQVSDFLQMKRRQTTGEEANVYLGLWMKLLLRLLELCLDRRQEARDGAIQILCRSIELYGGSLDSQAWEDCLWKVVFPLLNNLDEGLAWVATSLTGSEEKTPMGVPLPFKQWDDSKILAVNSVGSVFSHEISGVISTLSSYDRVVSHLIDYFKKSFLDGRQSVAGAAAKGWERLCAAKWPTADKKSDSDGLAEKGQQAKYLAETAWKAWLEVGEALRSHSRQGITQQNLESYLKVGVALQNNVHLDSDPDRNRKLLAVLKGVVVYPSSPDTRPDQDVLPSLQSTALAMIDRLDTSSSHLTVSAILEDYAEYTALAYRPTSSPQEPGQDSRKVSHRTTYIALTKHVSPQIIEVYQRHRSEPAIYAEAVPRVLATYAVPLRLKYDCPAPSKSSAGGQPLWKSATLHFLQIARLIIQSLQELSSSLDQDVVSLVWRKLIDGFSAALHADSHAMAAMPLELQRGEEDFDLALITTLQTSLLPYLGQSSVPDDAIRQLARSLQHASILYRPADEEASEVALRSPAMTLVGSGDSDALAGGSKMQAKGDGSLSSEGKSAIEGSTVPDVDLPGERFSYWSCDLLFSMCASKPTERGEQRRTRTSKPRRRKAIREERKADGCVDASEPTLDELIDGDVSMDERRRIATITLPCLIERCGSALESYLADSAIRGRLPFGRTREEELVYILDKLGQLELDEGVFANAFARSTASDSMNSGAYVPAHPPSIASLTRHSRRAHLFHFYRAILSLIVQSRFDDVSAPRVAPYRSLYPASSSRDEAVLGDLAANLKTDVPPTPHQKVRARGARELARQCLEIVGGELCAPH